METGVVLAILSARGVLSTDILIISKGLIWLLIATLAEVPPAVSLV